MAESASSAMGKASGAARADTVEKGLGGQAVNVIVARGAVDKTTFALEVAVFELHLVKEQAEEEYRHYAAAKSRLETVKGRVTAEGSFLTTPHTLVDTHPHRVDRAREATSGALSGGRRPAKRSAVNVWRAAGAEVERHRYRYGAAVQAVADRTRAVDKARRDVDLAFGKLEKAEEQPSAVAGRQDVADGA